MSEPNYESKWWGYIYDQMMTQDLQDRLEVREAPKKSPI